MEDIRKWETGAIRGSEEGKLDYNETISYSAMRRYADYMTGKKKLYWAWNFKKWIPTSSYEQSMLRHINEYMENKYEEWNLELEQDKLCAILFNIFGIIHNEEMEKKKFKIENKLDNTEDISIDKEYSEFMWNWKDAPILHVWTVIDI